MGKLIGCFCILLFFLLVAAPQELPAQTLFARIFHNSDNPGGGGNRLKKGLRHKRYHCGEMDAYNQKRAYRRYRSSRFRRVFARRAAKPSERSPVAQNSPNKSTTPPSKTSTTSTPKGAPTKEPPQKPEPVNKPKPTPPSDTAPPVAEKPPVTSAPQPNASKEEEKKDENLTRNSLKKMTRDQRLDTLLKKEPDIILTPLQFVSDQDEFSVVNMDSFIQAMEYAQQGKVVLVEGHTDDLGSDAYNLALSMKRAEKIRELLLSGGISDELISVIGYGERMPVVPNNSEENRSINRRIEFKIFSLPE